MKVLTPLGTSCSLNVFFVFFVFFLNLCRTVKFDLTLLHSTVFLFFRYFFNFKKLKINK